MLNSDRSGVTLATGRIITYSALPPIPGDLDPFDDDDITGITDGLDLALSQAQHGQPDTQTIVRAIFDALTGSSQLYRGPKKVWVVKNQGATCYPPAAVNGSIGQGLSSFRDCQFIACALEQSVVNAVGPNFESNGGGNNHPGWLTLIHELGHARQYVDDTEWFNGWFTRANNAQNGVANAKVAQGIIEADNMQKHEVPLAERFGYKKRYHYFNSKAVFCANRNTTTLLNQGQGPVAAWRLQTFQRERAAISVDLNRLVEYRDELQGRGLEGGTINVVRARELLNPPPPPQQAPQNNGVPTAPPPPS